MWNYYIKIKVNFPFPKIQHNESTKEMSPGANSYPKIHFSALSYCRGLCAPPSRALCGWDQEVIQFLISCYFYQVKCDRLGYKSGAADAHLHMTWFYCATRASDIKLLSRLVLRSHSFLENFAHAVDCGKRQQCLNSLALQIKSCSFETIQLPPVKHSQATSISLRRGFLGSIRHWQILLYAFNFLIWDS